MTTTVKADNFQGSLTIEFDNNRFLADLFGQFHGHLSIIEDRLGIQIVPQGNVLTLNGTAETVDMARDVLEHLYRRLERGEVIAVGDVQGAVRHAMSNFNATNQLDNAQVMITENGKKKGKQKADSHARGAQIRTRKKHITARSPNQSRYIVDMLNKELVFATGAAGTGKTYLAVAHAASRLERGEIKRIVLTRPAVEAGERLGFLPGDLKDKVDPYLRPLYDALYDVLPPEKVEKDLEAEVIEIAPLAFMRGRTLSDAVIILDEAQNTTSMQMKMFLTRLGENGQMIVTGDPSQVDLPRGEVSGLIEAVSLLKDINDIGYTKFDDKDVVRHPLVAKIITAYEKKK